MKKIKRFSIVIPTYQSKKQLANTLEALNRQKGVSLDAYEVIVADDGSSDGTGEMIKEINNNYVLKYVYIERTPESSRAKTRNAAISAAEGEIVVFLDSDIIVKQDYLSQVDKYFKFNQDILLIGHRIMMKEEVTPEDMERSNMFEADKFKMDSFEKFELRHALYLGASFNSRCNKYPWIHVFSCNMAVRKEFLDRAGYFDEGFRGWGLEDIELGYRLFKAGAAIVTGINIEAYHQPHSKISVNSAAVNRDEEIDANTLHFIDMHPEAMDNPLPTILAFFKGQARINYDLEARLKAQIFIDFKDRNQLESVKAEILKYAEKGRCRTYIYDYVEDTDLDIWIQLLEGIKSIPKYYPMLRGRTMKEIANVKPMVARYHVKKWSCIPAHEIRSKYFGKSGKKSEKSSSLKH